MLPQDGLLPHSPYQPWKATFAWIVSRPNTVSIPYLGITRIVYHSVTPLSPYMQLQTIHGCCAGWIRSYHKGLPNSWCSRCPPTSSVGPLKVVQWINVVLMMRHDKDLLVRTSVDNELDSHTWAPWQSLLLKARWIAKDLGTLRGEYTPRGADIF